MYESELRINFVDGRQANFVKTTLEVDEELQPTKISKALIVEGSTLIV